MKINVRLEGGLGDHLLGNRFIPAILEKYPNAEIKAFSDTENNPRSLDLILKCFPNFYKRGGEVIKERKNKQFMINSQFGNENWPSCILNQKDSTIEKMVNECDKFFDLCIDSLKWMSKDFDWLRYYHFFSKPQIEIATKYRFNYILAHLYARPDSPYCLDQEYVINLLSKLSEKQKVVVLVEEKYKDYYSKLFNNYTIEIDTSGDLMEIFNLAANCSAFIGMDSGVRYMPYHFSKPTFVFSSSCQKYGNLLPSHSIRWLLNARNVLPMHTEINTVCNILNNCCLNSAYALFPDIPEKIENYIVDRIL
jgi:ADP-heptose:LPS heptosyltransferase